MAAANDRRTGPARSTSGCFHPAVVALIAYKVLDSLRSGCRSDQERTEYLGLRQLPIIMLLSVIVDLKEPQGLQVSMTNTQSHTSGEISLLQTRISRKKPAVPQSRAIYKITADGFATPMSFRDGQKSGHSGQSSTSRFVRRSIGVRMRRKEAAFVEFGS